MCPETVSVIIATHGQRNRSLRRVLISLTQQSVRPHDVIVVGDDAPPATAKLVAQYPGFRFVALDRPGSAARARNAGARRCRGDRILVIDDDCVAPPDLVEAHAISVRLGIVPWAVILGFRNLVKASVHEQTNSDAPTDILALPFRHEQRLDDPHLGKMEDAANGPRPEIANYAWTCHFSVPRDVLYEVGGWWEEFSASGCEDCELALRLYRRGVPFAVLREPRVHHLDHAKCARQTSDYIENRKLFFQTKNHEKIVLRNGGPLLSAD